MELKVFTNKKGNALYYMRSVRKKGCKNPTKEKVEFLGYEDDLKKLYDDPIAHFRAEAKKLSSSAKEERKVSLSIDLDEHFGPGESNAGTSGGSPVADDLYCMGQLPLSTIYHELEIDQFVKNRHRNWGTEANADSIFRLLVFGRILFPGSKLGTWQKREKLMLGNSDFSDDDLYRSLSFFSEYSQDLILHLNEKVQKLYRRDSFLMFYDVTNYFWEIDNPDPDRYDDLGNVISEGMRKYGCSKEHRPEPIVQLGLFMDNDGLPVDFGLFPGNNNDVTTFLPMIERTREKLKLEKMIYVADKGMMSGTNIANILARKQGYIISASVRKQDADTVRFILDETGYTCSTVRMHSTDIHEELQRMDYTGTVREFDGDDREEQDVTGFKFKSRLIPARESSWVFDGSKKVQVRVNKRQVVFWSRKYQTRARIDRAGAILKAEKTGTVFNGHAANKYYRKDAYNPETGELLDKARHLRYLDMDRIANDEKLDGYYIIETNVVGTCKDERPWEGTARFRTYDCLFELNRRVSDQDIIDMYRGLWKIEESFKITKSYFEARPVFVRKQDSIQAHFLTCFVALLIIRILEVKKLGGKVPYCQIIEALQAAKLGEVKEHIFRNYCSAPLLKKIGLLTGLDLSKKFYTKQELRSMNNSTKHVD
jgi:transposase